MLFHFNSAWYTSSRVLAMPCVCLNGWFIHKTQEICQNFDRIRQNTPSRLLVRSLVREFPDPQPAALDRRSHAPGCSGFCVSSTDAPGQNAPGCTVQGEMPQFYCFMTQNCSKMIWFMEIMTSFKDCVSLYHTTVISVTLWYKLDCFTDLSLPRIFTFFANFTYKWFLWSCNIMTRGNLCDER